MAQTEKANLGRSLPSQEINALAPPGLEFFQFNWNERKVSKQEFRSLARQ